MTIAFQYLPCNVGWMGSVDNQWNGSRPVNAGSVGCLATEFGVTLLGLKFSRFFLFLFDLDLVVLDFAILAKAIRLGRFVEDCPEAVAERAASFKPDGRAANGLRDLRVDATIFGMSGDDRSWLRNRYTDAAEKGMRDVTHRAQFLFLFFLSP